MVGLRMLTVGNEGEKYEPFPVFFRRHNDRYGMRGIFQEIVVFRLFPRNDFLCLLTDFDHCITKSCGYVNIGKCVCNLFTLTCRVLLRILIPWVQSAYKFEWAKSMSVDESHNPKQRKKAQKTVTRDDCSRTCKRFAKSETLRPAILSNSAKSMRSS
jgi:hypothetical protein